MKIHGIICDFPDVIGFRALSKSDFDRTSTILVDEWFRYLTKTKKQQKSQTEHNYHYFELAQYILHKTAILTEKSVGISKNSIFTSAILFLFNRLCERVFLSKIWRLKDFSFRNLQGSWGRTEWHYVILSEVCRTLKNPDSVFWNSS